MIFVDKSMMQQLLIKKLRLENIPLLKIPNSFQLKLTLLETSNKVITTAIQFHINCDYSGRLSLKDLCWVYSQE